MLKNMKGLLHPIKQRQVATLRQNSQPKCSPITKQYIKVRSKSSLSFLLP